MEENVNKPPLPPNHLVMAILTTIFCCWPLGIPAIIFATQVNSKYIAGDYAGAAAASGNAKMWSLFALGAGALIALLYVAYVVVMFVIAAAGAAAQN